MICKLSKTAVVAISIIVMMVSCSKNTRKPEDRLRDFWLGADISSANGMKSQGIFLKGFDGQERYELTQLMKSMGLNAVRYRVWVDPEEVMLSSHAGMCDKEDLLANCLMAKALDMAIMVDFHYSDTWADPSHQSIPKAWFGHDYETMKIDLFNYTVDVLNLLKDNGIEPKWVQIGNETDCGLLWNRHGDSDEPEEGEHLGHCVQEPQQYAGFIDMGHKAVKTVFPQCKTLIHLSKGYDKDLYDWNLGVLERYGAKYDMVGMSLYPYWAAKSGRPDADGVIEDCMANIKHVYNRFGKESMIVETGYEVDEHFPGIIDESYRQFSKAIRDARDRTDNHCHGIFYWSPESRPGAGIYNLGAFGSDDRPTKIMRAFVEASSKK